MISRFRRKIRLRCACHAQKLFGEGQDPQQDEKTGREGYGVKRADALPNQRQVPLTVSAADQDPGSDCQTAADRGKYMAQLRQVGNRGD